ncbi:MAG: DNA endonuclease SmrA [Porticoccaceae bacterium]|nr:DNA endonuclease SmrA [Porticoccaceae bacterium]
MSSTDGREKLESGELSDKQFVDMVGDDIQPLSGKGSAHIAKPVQITPGVLERRKAAQKEVVAESNILDPVSIIEQVDPLAYLEFVRPGVQHGVYKNLRLGKYEIQSRLDLHRHTVEQARNALWHFVDDCHKHGVRCALVTHGKGEGREQPARLKSCVNHWLRQFDQVLAFHSAKKTHGGVGATYILVKKDSSARRETTDKINQAKRMKR